MAQKAHSPVFVFTVQSLFFTVQSSFFTVQSSFFTVQSSFLTQSSLHYLDSPILLLSSTQTSFDAGAGLSLAVILSFIRSFYLFTELTELRWPTRDIAANKKVAANKKKLLQIK